jgi:pilus assembly protein Flp/PilA
LNVFGCAGFGPRNATHGGCSSDSEDAHVYKLLDRLHRGEEGAALAEYGLLIALIAVVCIVAVTALGTGVSRAFSLIAASISAAV